MKNLNIFLKLIILGQGIYAFQGCIPGGDHEPGGDPEEVLIESSSTDTSKPVKLPSDTSKPVDPRSDTSKPGDPPSSTSKPVDTTIGVTTLKGIILYSNQKPARHIKVRVQGKGKMVKTNQRGEYKIPGELTDLLEITLPNGETQLFRPERRIILPAYDPPPRPDLSDPVLQIVALSDHISLIKDENDQRSFSYTIEKRSNGQIVNSGQIDSRLYFSSLGLQNEVQYTIKIETPNGPKTSNFSLINDKINPECTLDKNSNK